MILTGAQRDRAAGVLLGQAIGDALGVPYEFASGPEGDAEMVGGGLGPYAPGEWSDDTQMALCIARVSSTGADLTTPEALEAVAVGFLNWRRHGASDIGVGTSSVLGAAMRGDGPVVDVMRDASRQQALSGRGAGNGALMRTGIVGLTRLDDRDATAQAAAAIAELTHADQRCVESSVLWSEAVRVAVLHGRMELRGGLDLLPDDRRGFWADAIDAAEVGDPSRFTPNGFTVTALQAAWSAIHVTRDAASGEHVAQALQRAISIGNDTDTVAAIAGTLLGARHGASGLPTDWARRVHGWPDDMRSRDLVILALATAQRGHKEAWPGLSSTISGLAHPLAAPHPHDPDVILGTEADLASCPSLGVTAVVSLSRVGDVDIAATGVEPHNHADVWLIDAEDPEQNANPGWTILDAARTVRQLRKQGNRVLLHCVGAEHRTPAVALAYSRLLGVELETAQAEVAEAVGHRCGGLLWEAASAVTGTPDVATGAGSADATERHHP